MQGVKKELKFLEIPLASLMDQMAVGMGGRAGSAVRKRVWQLSQEDQDDNTG